MLIACRTWGRLPIPSHQPHLPIKLLMDQPIREGTGKQDVGQLIKANTVIGQLMHRVGTCCALPAEDRRHLSQPKQKKQQKKTDRNGIEPYFKGECIIICPTLSQLGRGGGAKRGKLGQLRIPALVTKSPYQLQL